ncbi:hypothetical protein B0H14DRAFT_3655521 [Mycena olivaceomarginata]|nr:hypothetical protein B0H14DRAFT_3655521 [Mycena olivaceomarginata]
MPGCVSLASDIIDASSSSTETIIIIASSVAFKVHRGQLRRHSEVFDDLFSIPQPKIKTYAMAGPGSNLPSVGPWVLFPLPRRRRLSTKYLIEHLCQRCMARLEVDWPSTLAAWDQRERAATEAFGHDQLCASWPHPLLTLAIALALGPDLAHLLPAALYDLSCYGPSKILSGTPPRRSTPRAAPLSPHLCLAHPRRAQTNTPHVRAPPHIRGCEGRAGLPCHLHLHATACARPAPLCAYLEDKPPARHTCRELFYFIMLNVLRSVGGIACGHDADSLFTLLQAVEMLERMDFSDGTRVCGLRMCAACKVDFREGAGRAKEEVWGLLPGWFGLEGRGQGRAAQQEVRDEMVMDM